MSILYSYPTTQPTLADLLIGTSTGDDNSTSTYTVESLVSLINAEAGSGTLTSVTISTDAFLTATGNPTGPVVAYTIGLAATGTPSAATFLRGDNKWVTPTVTSGIIVSSDNVNVTTDLASVNFTGAGVIANSDAAGNVTVQIEGATNAVSSVAAGAGITIPSSTGDVVVTNSGVLRVIAGANISISPTTGVGDVTITSTSTGGSSLGSVGAGDGLVLDSGTTVLNPVLGVNYGGTGLDNYITGHTAAATALGPDSIPFLQASSSAVKYTTLEDIQASTLTLLDTAITDANADAIVNTYDKANQSAITNGVAPAYQVVTLTQGNYDALVTAGTTNANYLYFTKAGAAAATFTKTLAITLNISGNASTSYSLSGDQVGATQTGVLGAAYGFSTGISNTGSTTISNIVINNASGSQTDPSSTVTTTISAAINNIVAGTGYASVSISNQLTLLDGAGASGGGIYTIAAASNPLSGTAPFSFSSSSFGVGLTLNASSNQWEILNTNVGYYPPSGTASSGQTVPVTATVTGTVQKKSQTLTFLRTTSGITGGTEGVDYTLSSSGTPGLSSSASGATATGKVGDTYSYSTSISMLGSKIISGFNGATAVTGSFAGGSAAFNVTQNLSGSISSSQGSAILTATNNITGSALGTGYTISYSFNVAGGSSGSYTPGNSVTGTNGALVTFSAVVSALSGYSSSVTQTYTTNPIALSVAGATTSLTFAGTVTATRSTVGMAGQGGSPGTGPDPNPSCSYSITSTAYTDSDITNGVTAGMYLYDANSGTNPYGGSSQSYRCNSVNIGGTASVGYVTFGAAGYIQSVGSC
jgi:hypothetical protein